MSVILWSLGLTLLILFALISNGKSDQRGRENLRTPRYWIGVRTNRDDQDEDDR